jgi:hypothetical protein
MDIPTPYTHLPHPVMPKVPPQKLLLGQKALVTGASSGIGRLFVDGGMTLYPGFETGG